MPYKSDAQRKKFHQLAKEGKISQATVDEFDKASAGKKLPDRVKPKKETKRPSTIAELRKAYKDKYGQ